CGRRGCDKGGGSRDASCRCRIRATKARRCTMKVYCVYDTLGRKRTGMSDLAIPADPGEGEAPATARNRAMILVCVGLAALWFAAAFALVQSGRTLAVTASRGAAPAVQPAARLQARAEAMTAT